MSNPMYDNGEPWPEVLTTEEVARALRLDLDGDSRMREREAAVRAVRRLVEREVLKPCRLGKALRFSRAAVSRCIERLTEGDDPEG